MAKALYINVLEDRSLLKELLRTAKPWARPRLIMLLEMQKSGESGITKETLMQRVGVCGQSINNWRKAYRNGGLSQLLSHKKQVLSHLFFHPQRKQNLANLLKIPKTE